VNVRTPRQGEPLTGREIEILLSIAHGHTAATCGRELGIHRTTVKTHMYRIRNKLGARSGAHAVAIALRTGVFSLDAITLNHRKGPRS